MCTCASYLTEMSVSYNVKELFSGVLNKCGAKIKSWNRRWFVLKSDYCLYYYKDTAKGHLGAISLRDPKFEVRKGSVSDIAWPKGVTMECTIAVVTSHRTYFMYSLGESEADDWLRVLNSTREKLLEEANSANRLLSGSRSYSATTTNNNPANNGSPDYSKQRLSESIPPALHEDGPELTYEAVYDSPEADLSQSGSCNGSPNLDIKQGERHESTTDSIYDLASGEEGGRHEGVAVDTSQPLYAEAAEPDEQDGEVDEPSAVYDDVETMHQISHTHSSHTPQRQADSSGGKDKPVEVYEPIDAESPHTPSAKHLPLPAIPMVTRSASSANSGGQPIYEDIPDPNGAQPLYEAVMVDDSPTHEKYVQESERSDDEGTGPLPPLPPKDDPLPPLPPKDSNAPQLPPKGGQSSSSLPPKTAVEVPLLPPKEDQPSPHGNTRTHVLPPLLSKDESSETGNYQPLASSRHGHGSPSSSVAQQVSSAGSLSPSGQRKPIPRERTLTPPPTKKPSPVPRRRVSPTAGGQASTADGSHVSGRASDLSRAPQPSSSTAGENTSSKATCIPTSAAMARRSSQESLPSSELISYYTALEIIHVYNKM